MIRRAAFAVLVACGGHAAPQSVEIPLPQRQAGPRDAYEIRLSRPSSVGERSHVILTGEMDRITTSRSGSAQPTEEHEKRRARMNADLTVLSLDDNGEIADVACDVRDLQLSRDGREVLHNKSGRIVIKRAPKEDDAEIAVDGSPASAEVREALKAVMSLRRGGPSDDQVLGTRVPQRVGSHWRTNDKVALDDLIAQEGPDVSSAVISGDAWLEGVTSVDGVDCLGVRARLRIDNIDFSSKAPGAKIDLARVVVSFSGAFPVDTSLSRMADHMVIETMVKMHMPTPMADIKVELEGVEKRDAIYQPVSR